MYTTEALDYQNLIPVYLMCFLVQFVGLNSRYFEQEDEEEGGTNSGTLAYIPAPGSPSWDLHNQKKDSDSEEDPLDAFMAGLEVRPNHSACETPRVITTK